MGWILIVYSDRPEKAAMLRIMVVAHLALLVVPIVATILVDISFDAWFSAAAMLLLPSLPVPIFAWIGVEKNARASKFDMLRGKDDA